MMWPLGGGDLVTRLSLSALATTASVAFGAMMDERRKKERENGKKKKEQKKKGKKNRKQKGEKCKQER